MHILSYVIRQRRNISGTLFSEGKPVRRGKFELFESIDDTSSGTIVCSTDQVEWQNVKFWCLSVGLIEESPVVIVWNRTRSKNESECHFSWCPFLEIKKCTKEMTLDDKKSMFDAASRLDWKHVTRLEVKNYMEKVPYII